jgi:hypothetical protein
VGGGERRRIVQAIAHHQHAPAAARDTGILIFGLGLFAAGVLFVWWMIKTAYDEAESDVSAA